MTLNTGMLSNDINKSDQEILFAITIMTEAHKNKKYIKFLFKCGGYDLLVNMKLTRKSKCYSFYYRIKWSLVKIPITCNQFTHHLKIIYF